MSDRSPRGGLVLVFGESLNDSKSLAHLLVAANPDLDRRVRPLPRPTSLTRDAGQKAVRDWVDDLRRTVTGFRSAGATVTAALVHRDADGADPSGAQEEKLGVQIRAVPASPVVPVQAMEAWWFLFPEAVESVRPHTWRDRIPRHARDVEQIDRPKRKLVHLTGHGTRQPYAEVDSIRIAEFVRHGAREPVGRSASFDRFQALARRL